MTDSKQIPHLVKLLDDESVEVCATVTKELVAFGSTLKNELRKMTIPLTPVQKGRIEEILEGHRRTWLKRVWTSWGNLPVHKGRYVSDYKRLEGALSILAEFLSGLDYDFKLKDLLDDLAASYKRKFNDNNPITLASFLFKKKGLAGDEEDYYNSQNSNLVYVIKKKKGMPISLTAVYMLVGLRLGIKVEGCHFPGHFLARIDQDGKKIFVDCFNGGHIIEEKDLLNIKHKTFKGMAKILHEKTNTQMMVRRFLANLIRSFQIQEEEENSELLIGLFSDMDAQINSKKVSELTPEDIINFVKQAFLPGQCVCHKRYGYRGIIVDVDEDCTATDSWYYANQTQPSQHQPWYHVLVDGSDQVTYVAENNLLPDESKASVIHPLLSYFFTKTTEGSYIRNDNIWPGTDF